MSKTQLAMYNLSQQNKIKRQHMGSLQNITLDSDSDSINGRQTVRPDRLELCQNRHKNSLRISRKSSGFSIQKLAISRKELFTSKFAKMFLARQRLVISSKKASRILGVATFSVRKVMEESIKNMGNWC